MEKRNRKNKLRHKTKERVLPTLKVLVIHRLNDTIKLEVFQGLKLSCFSMAKPFSKPSTDFKS